ncbi:MAG: hypothetical protein J6O04_01680 [Selenomonadaceae bacterium]|nr:hypothetical protein [Selenomonadaceae bacterium]
MFDAIKNWFSPKKTANNGGLPLTNAELASIKDDKPYFNRLYSYGIRGSQDEIVIYLIDPVKKIKYLIVDEEGNFVNFPGIENEFLLKPYYKGNSIAPTIGFRSEFQRDSENGKLIARWQLQPDGWYWADEDGYGAEDDLEIVLYTYITEDGKFEAPFRIYEIGRVTYYGTDLEEREKQEYEERQEVERKRIESGESVDDAIRRFINMTADEFIKIAGELDKEFFVCFDLPASDYEAMLRMVGREPEWSLYVDVKIRGTDRLFSNIYSKKDDGGRHSREWIIEELKKPETRDFIFNSIKHLSERIDRD